MESSSSSSFTSWLLSRVTLLLPHHNPTLAAFAASLLIFHLINRHRRVPVNWPLAGMIPAVVANFDRLHDWSTELLRAAGSSFVIKSTWGPPLDVLLTADPENVAHIFTNNFRNYPKGKEFRRLFDVLGGGIFNADGESWAFQRRMAHAFMSDPRFKLYAATAMARKLETCLVPLLSNLMRANRVVDLQDILMRLTFDTTATVVFGFDPGCLTADGQFPTVPFATAMDEAEEVLFYRHVIPLFWLKLQYRLHIGHAKRMAGARAVLDRCIAEYIARRRAVASANSSSSKSDNFDLLSSYLSSQSEVKKDNTQFDEFLRDTTLNLMVAGRDTTSSALTWFFWLLHNHPDVEAKILAELKMHPPESPSGYHSLAQLKQLIYTHAALCESLRLYPPVPFEHKVARHHDVLPCGIMVKGYRRRVMVSFYAMGRMEEVWGKDCLEFRPERWLSDTGKLRHEPSYKFVAFNVGPRTCIGKDLAFTQMKAVVAAVLPRFEVAVINGFVVKPKLSIILHMKDGLKVKVRRREKGIINY